MSKKNFRPSADDVFNAGTPSNSSWDATDSQIYGGSEIFEQLGKVDAQITRVQKLSIFSIMPDPTQPRRAVPSSIRRYWDGTPKGVPVLFQKWWEGIQIERGTTFELGAYLEENERVRDMDEPIKAGVLEENLMNLIGLAVSIRRDGLTNPITVAPAGGLYRLETGERRWLAYHLLYAWFDGTDGKPDERSQWENIPCREVEAVNVWRQASENSARANLNTISRARQFALLMMNLYSNQRPFLPLDSFPHERQFYAQARELNTPAGKSEMLLNAMGVKHRSSLARLRAMFDLPDAIWQVGDDENWSEEWLYDMARLEPDVALARMAQLRNNTATIRQSNDDSLTDEASLKHAMDLETDNSLPGTKRHFARLTRLLDNAGRGKYKTNNEALKAVRDLQMWLNEQEAKLKKFMD
jgi:hypothetical protein